MDIKTQLLTDLDSILKYGNGLYTVIGLTSIQIYQGFIATPKGNPIFPILIQKLLGVQDYQFKLCYWIITIQFYYTLVKYLNKFPLNSKLYQHHKGNIILLTEKNNNNCKQLDQYGLCTYIHNLEGEPIIKTRYNDYPWK